MQVQMVTDHFADDCRLRAWTLSGQRQQTAGLSGHLNTLTVHKASRYAVDIYEYKRHPAFMSQLSGRWHMGNKCKQPETLCISRQTQAQIKCHAMEKH